jgi:hypothetical protein
MIVIIRGRVVAKESRPVPNTADHAATTPGHAANPGRKVEGACPLEFAASAFWCGPQFSHQPTVIAAFDTMSRRIP